MAEEKMECCGCNKGKLFMTLGILAIVYGIINYFIVAMQWSGYVAWIIGGIILLLIGWAKKSMKS